MNKIQSLISDNRNLFERVASQHSVSINNRYQKYTILNYKKILDELCEFIKGYVSYKGEDGETYRGKVLSTTVHFYEQMFTDKKAYRVNFDLTDMNGITEDFLKGSKELQSLINTYSAEEHDDDKELKSLISLTENQYAKVMKVHKDDMQIYIWLTTRDNRVGRANITPTLLSAFKDQSTPVIHEKKD